jgi:hypothetical protein
MILPMNIIELSPVSEALRFFAGWRRELTKIFRPDEELMVDAAEQIVVEIADQHREIEASAHKAETYDREALARIKEAQSPDSEGGSAITVNEARRFIPFVTKSAELDHDIGGKAKVEAV